MTVHNHQPWRPMCPERIVNGQLRGACLNDDGTGRPAPTPEVEAGERETCPRDGQSLAFHRVTEIGPNGLPRTNGEFMGCDFGTEPDHPTRWIHYIDTETMSFKCTNCGQHTSVTKGCTEVTDHPLAPSQSPQGSELGDGAVEALADRIIEWQDIHPGDRADLIAELAQFTRQREAAAWDRCMEWVRNGEQDPVNRTLNGEDANPFRANRGDAS